MNKSLRIYLIVLGVIILLLALLEMNKTEIINWSKSYDVTDKNPFGLFVFNEEADVLFDKNLTRTEVTPYEYFSRSATNERKNYLFVNNDITNAGLNKLLSRIKKGDNAFFINPYYTTKLTDTLGLEVNYIRYGGDNLLQLKDQKFVQDSIYIDKQAEGLAITEIDTLTTKILGTSLDGKDALVANFVQVQYGRGNVYLHLEPLVLTNYYLLQDDNYKYAENIFSYLPKRKTIWFTENDTVENQSIMRFILSQKPLRYAWYTFLVGLLLFAIFTAKRRQRVIPIIEPKKNSSAEFVQTIGNLYLQEGNYKDMASKKATYFMNRIRAEYHLDTHELNAEFIHKLQLKTGAKKSVIEKAIPLLQKALHTQAPVQEKELIELNHLLDQILQNR